MVGALEKEAEGLEVEVESVEVAAQGLEVEAACRRSGVVLRQTSKTHWHVLRQPCTGNQVP